MKSKEIKELFNKFEQIACEYEGVECWISAMERGRESIGRKMAHRLANALGTSYKNFFW